MINISKLINIDISTTESKWKNIATKSELQKLCQDLVINTFSYLKFSKEISKQNKKIQISFHLINDKEIQKINFEYRNKNKPTNVLSFPLFEQEFLKALKLQPEVALGDIFISYETLKKESIELNIDFQDHLKHLIIHSVLHLLGYDHQKDKQAKEMETIEQDILSFYK